MKEYMALKFTWGEVGGIIEQLLESRLERSVLCEVKPEDELYWALRFSGCRLTADEIHALCDFVGADEDMRIESEPDNGVSANSIGMRLALALFKKQLKVKAEEQLITEYALWLVGIENE